MLVEIDDAGTGSPVGGVVIGCRKNDIFVYEVIPPSNFYNKGVFSIEIQTQVKEIVKRLLQKVNFNSEEDEILICSSRIFNETRNWLERQNIKWKVGRIRGKTQDLVEFAFDFHLLKIGVPRLLLKRLIEYKHYVIELLKWVALDLENRSKYVKKSFRVWQNIWSKVRIVFEEGKNNKNKKYCIICGGDIKEDNEIVTIKYITPTRIYTSIAHKKCIKGLL